MDTAGCGVCCSISLLACCRGHAAEIICAVGLHRSLVSPAVQAATSSCELAKCQVLACWALPGVPGTAILGHAVWGPGMDQSAGSCHPLQLCHLATCNLHQALHRGIDSAVTSCTAGGHGVLCCHSCLQVWGSAQLSPLPRHGCCPRRPGRLHSRCSGSRRSAPCSGWPGCASSLQRQGECCMFPAGACKQNVSLTRINPWLQRAVVAQVAAPHLAVAAPESPCTGEPALTPQFYFSGWDAST
jgi:hypothetical protein